MSNSDFNDRATSELVFSDPISYLAGLGVDAELVADSSMPAAA